jgi:hypothetical protein
MFKYLIKGLLAGIVVRLLEHYRRLSVELLKIEAAKCYLHGVQMARRSAIGLVWVGLLTGLICVGGLLLHAGLFILLPWPLETKAVVALCLGVGYMATGGVALHAAMDEEMWMKKSGAVELLKEATGQAGKDDPDGNDSTHRAAGARRD